jgi:hypothetical protein
MFGFLIGAEVNDDAVKLKTLIDMARAKYAAMADGELRTAVATEFDKNHYRLESEAVTFVYPELEEFLITLDSKPQSTGPRSVSALGRGRYAGVMIQVMPDGDWFCVVKGGMAYEPTGGARKIARVLTKKYGVQDMIKRFGL